MIDIKGGLLLKGPVRALLSYLGIVEGRPEPSRTYAASPSQARLLSISLTLGRQTVCGFDVEHYHHSAPLGHRSSHTEITA